MVHPATGGRQRCVIFPSFLLNKSDFLSFIAAVQPLKSSQATVEKVGDNQSFVSNNLCCGTFVVIYDGSGVPPNLVSCQG